MEVNKKWKRISDESREKVKDNFRFKEIETCYFEVKLFIIYTKL